MIEPRIIQKIALCVFPRDFWTPLAVFKAATDPLDSPGAPGFVSNLFVCLFGASRASSVTIGRTCAVSLLHSEKVVLVLGLYVAVEIL